MCADALAAIETEFAQEQSPTRWINPGWYLLWAYVRSFRLMSLGPRYEQVLVADLLAAGIEGSERLANALVADLTAGLEVMSGGTFKRFGSVRFESPAVASQVRVVRNGDIVVGRFRGVRDSLKAVGYGGRTARANGTITGGTVMLDEDYDQRTQQPRLLRMHELGHALGFNHVDSLRSVMNPTIGTEPTDFDRRVARIAFSHITPDRAARTVLARAD